MERERERENNEREDRNSETKLSHLSIGKKERLNEDNTCSYEVN